MVSKSPVRLAQILTQALHKYHGRICPLTYGPRGSWAGDHGVALVFGGVVYHLVLPFQRCLCQPRPSTCLPPPAFSVPGTSLRPAIMRALASLYSALGSDRCRRSRGSLLSTSSSPASIPVRFYTGFSPAPDPQCDCATVSALTRGCIDDASYRRHKWAMSPTRRPYHARVNQSRAMHTGSMQRRLQSLCNPQIELLSGTEGGHGLRCIRHHRTVRPPPSVSDVLDAFSPGLKDTDDEQLVPLLSRLTVPDFVAALPPPQIVAVLCALATGGVRQVHVLRVLTDALSADWPRTDDAIADLLWALAVLQYRPQPLLTALQHWLMKWAPRLRTRHLPKTLWALAALDCQNDALFRALLQRVLPLPKPVSTTHAAQVHQAVLHVACNAATLCTTAEALGLHPHSHRPGRSPVCGGPVTLSLSRMFARHARCRLRNSDFQKDVARVLRAMGFELETEVQLPDGGGYVVDILLKADVRVHGRVVVEADGPDHFCRTPSLVPPPDHAAAAHVGASPVCSGTAKGCAPGAGLEPRLIGHCPEEWAVHNGAVDHAAPATEGAPKGGHVLRQRQLRGFGYTIVAVPWAVWTRHGPKEQRMAYLWDLLHTSGAVWRPQLTHVNAVHRGGPQSRESIKGQATP